MKSTNLFSPTPLSRTEDSYMEQMIKYLHEPSPEARLLLEEKMIEYSRHSGILLHFEKLQKKLIFLERGYESAWESFAKEAENTWYFDMHPEHQEMFFEAAHKRGLAKKKWVICS